MPTTASLRTLTNANPALLDLQIELPSRFQLAEVGQRVTIAPEHVQYQQQIGMTFEITEVMERGGHQYCVLRDGSGGAHRYFRADELLPARAVSARRLDEEAGQMSPDTIKAAERFEASVKASGLPVREAIDSISLKDPMGANAYRLRGISTDATAEPVLSLSASFPFQAGESFDDLAERYARDKNVSLANAVRAVGQMRPDLAAAR